MGKVKELLEDVGNDYPMEEPMNQELEEAVIAACQAMTEYIAILKSQKAAVTAPRTQTAHVERPGSNGIPDCPIHKRVMREGKYGYYCTAKEDNPDLSNNNGYCNYKLK